MKLRFMLVMYALSACFAAGVTEQNTIQKTFPIERSDGSRLEVDTVYGAIRVTGYEGREVQMTAHRTVEADSQEKLEEARRDVRLDLSEKGGTVRLYVDGPFRCKCSEGGGHAEGRGYTGFKVRYDFEVRVPRQASVFLRTVNEGGIHVEKVAGDYDIRNINGGVELLDTAGSGRVYALNGGVKVTFTRNPRADSYFGSLNGPVDLMFQPDLSADLSMKTFNGQIYSDFPAVPLPAKIGSTEVRAGKHLYKADRFTHARVGAGGPEIQLDGFNGDIRILKRQ